MLTNSENQAYYSSILSDRMDVMMQTAELESPDIVNAIGYLFFLMN